MIILGLYILAGLYDQRVFAYTIFGGICIFALISYIINDMIDRIFPVQPKKENFTKVGRINRTH